MREGASAWLACLLLTCNDRATLSGDASIYWQTDRCRMTQNSPACGTIRFTTSQTMCVQLMDIMFVIWSVDLTDKAALTASQRYRGFEKRAMSAHLTRSW